MATVANPALRVRSRDFKVISFLSSKLRGVRHSSVGPAWGYRRGLVRREHESPTGEEQKK
jgi:hypothetical protein